MITAGIFDFSTMIGVCVCNIPNVKERVIYPWIDQMGLIWRWKCIEGSKKDISADSFTPGTHAGAWARETEEGTRKGVWVRDTGVGSVALSAGWMFLIYNLFVTTETMLLKTKLNMPVLRESLVPRRRLVDQLNADLWTEDGFIRKLTLISAPAGYGKTTAAVEWLSEHKGQVLWLSLDEDDNDPARFITYLATVFQELDAGIGRQTLQMMRSPAPPAGEILITALINDIALVQSPVILALDDYHFIQTAKIHEMVSFFLEHQPIHLHQVVLTREDPLLPVSRMLSRGQAIEIRQEDLRFTSRESEEFLGQKMGVKLAKVDMEALRRRTEGWAAGLQFAALSLQGHPDIQNYVQQFTGSNRYILDYLFEEVLNKQPAAVQDFLVRTSILDQLTAELCDVIAEREESQKVLEALERSNLFIVPLDFSREWYRYHRLFRDLLRHRLQIHEPALEIGLHLKASEWYEAHGMQAEAVQHALLAKEWSRAGGLVLDLSNRMMKKGEIVTLLGWFKQFPDEVMRSNPGAVPGIYLGADPDGAE